MYHYYVASFCVWTIVSTLDAKTAIFIAEKRPEFKDKPIRTVRIATRDEIEEFNEYQYILKRAAKTKSETETPNLHD